MKRRLIGIFVLVTACNAFLKSQVSLVSSDTFACDTLHSMVYLEPAESYDTITSLSWTINDTIDGSTGDSLVIMLEKPGIYSVKARINGNSHLTLNPDLRVFSSPEAGFQFYDTTSNYDFTYVFRSSPQPDDTLNYTYLWLIDGEEAGDSPVITYSFPETGRFPVTLNITNSEGCTASHSENVVVTELLKCPNVFTPNMDGYNDFFSVKTDGNTLYDFRVYSRSGLEVYHTESPTIFWDGRSLSGVEMQPGIYYFTIESLNKPEQEEISGFVHLIR